MTFAKIILILVNILRTSLLYMYIKETTHSIHLKCFIQLKTVAVLNWNCRNKMSGIPVKMHGKKTHKDFLNKLMETNGKHLALSAASKANWIQKWNEKLRAACEYCIILVIMHREYPLAGEKTLPSSLGKNYKNGLKWQNWLLLAI